MVEEFVKNLHLTKDGLSWRDNLSFPGAKFAVKTDKRVEIYFRVRAALSLSLFSLPLSLSFTSRTGTFGHRSPMQRSHERAGTAGPRPTRCASAEKTGRSLARPRCRMCSRVRNASMCARFSQNVCEPTQARAQ